MNIDAIIDANCAQFIQEMTRYPRRARFSLAPVLFALAAAFTFVTSDLAVAAPRDFEADFNIRCRHYRYVEGVTDEPSCGGTTLGVYLDGRRIKELAYSTETSRRLILRDYYFDGSDLALVVETVYGLLDDAGNHTKHPKLESKRRFRIGDTPAAKKREFIDRADDLIRFYRSHAVDFRETKSSVR